MMTTNNKVKILGEVICYGEIYLEVDKSLLDQTSALSALFREEFTRQFMEGKFEPILDTWQEENDDH